MCTRHNGHWLAVRKCDFRGTHSLQIPICAIVGWVHKHSSRCILPFTHRFQSCFRSHSHPFLFYHSQAQKDAAAAASARAAADSALESIKTEMKREQLQVGLGMGSTEWWRQSEQITFALSAAPDRQLDVFFLHTTCPVAADRMFVLGLANGGLVVTLP